MLHVSQPFLFRCGAFTDLVFHIVVALALIDSCRGQSAVVGPSQPIVALVGDDITLPCYLDPVTDAFLMTVEWARPDLDPRFVLVWRDGVELESKKHPSYRGRTSVSMDQLKHGDVSLKLSRVRISDEGRYRCFFPILGKDSTMQLVVGAVSSPGVQMTKNSSGVVLECKSDGWYPEPEVLWLDGEGNLLSAGPTETVLGPDGLYTVSSRVTVEKRHSNRFTCRVQQRNINQTRETHIQISDDFFSDPGSGSGSGSGSSAPTIIGLVVGIVFILTAVFGVWKWRQNKITVNNKDKKIKELQEELEKKKREAETKQESGEREEEEMDQREAAQKEEVVGLLLETMDDLERKKIQHQKELENMEKLQEGIKGKLNDMTKGKTKATNEVQETFIDELMLIELKD